jgi:hypothetical protein
MPGPAGGVGYRAAQHVGQHVALLVAFCGWLVVAGFELQLAPEYRRRCFQVDRAGDCVVFAGH